MWKPLRLIPAGLFWRRGPDSVHLFPLHGRKDSVWQTLPEEEKKEQTRMGILGGICCGCILCSASCLSSLALTDNGGKSRIYHDTVHHHCAVYGAVLKEKKIGINIWISAVIAAVGMYFLCMTESFSIGAGDRLVLMCSVVFSVHILVIDYFSRKPMAW